MRRRAKAFLTGGLTGNVSAQGFALAVQLVVALVTVPIFARTWGLENYGLWLLLFTLPSYLALADFGYGGAAANAMTADVARGERNKALGLHRELTGATASGSLAVFALIAILVWLAGKPLLGFAESAADGRAVPTVLALAVYALVALNARARGNALRATGHYAKATYCIGFSALLAVVLAGVAALAGKGFLGAACGYALGEAVGFAIMTWLVARHAPDFRSALLPKGALLLAPLTHAALGLVSLAVGFALILQGSIIALGAAVGAAAVPAFTALRTISRVGVQSVGVVSLAVTPELTMARARGDAERARDLVSLNLAVAMVLVVPAIGVLVLFGQDIVDLWSGGVIHTSRSLVAVMAIIMALGVLWGPLAAFLTADNLQSRYAHAFVLFATVGVALAYPLAKVAGGTGAGIAMALAELALLLWCWRQARRAGFVDAGVLRNAPARALALVQSRLGKG